MDFRYCGKNCYCSINLLLCRRGKGWYLLSCFSKNLARARVTQWYPASRPKFLQLKVSSLKLWLLEEWWLATTFTAGRLHWKIINGQKIKMLRQEILGMLQDAPATGFQFEHSKDFRIERNKGLQLAMFANRGHPLAGRGQKTRGAVQWRDHPHSYCLARRNGHRFLESFFECKWLNWIV